MSYRAQRQLTVMLGLLFCGLLLIERVSIFFVILVAGFTLLKLWLLDLNKGSTRPKEERLLKTQIWNTASGLQKEEHLVSGEYVFDVFKTSARRIDVLRFEQQELTAAIEAGRQDIVAVHFCIPRREKYVLKTVLTASIAYEHGEYLLNYNDTKLSWRDFLFSLRHDILLLDRIQLEELAAQLKAAETPSDN
jgi:hypothetical protein